MDDAKKYLDLIGQHLQEHHASILVGAGFSRNAAKTDRSIPDSPTWSDLAKAFAQKLSADVNEQAELRKLSPLELAERVEAIFGRPVLEQILRSQVRDKDYLPSELHRALLKLPWSDIFTTNYDTLLERASEAITERSFSVITEKEDLIGSCGTARIVKLHGSLPSHRPFILTSEDYRTYPVKFAPFVNTVQQSLLENTLCLIGFSGDDPNFEQWIGWIRDNLGDENAPNIYLLRHKPCSGAEEAVWRRRKIIPVDLSQLASGESPAKIYETALNYLLKMQRDATQEGWKLNRRFHDRGGRPLPLKDALVTLREIRTSYPGWLTVPVEHLGTLRSVRSDAAEVLYTCRSSGDTAMELEYLYEYDWLREKTLLPPFSEEIECYRAILARHKENSFQKTSIQLSLLRDLRESGEWEKWDSLRDELGSEGTCIDQEQRQQLQWEDCMCAMSRYQYKKLKECLDRWRVDLSRPHWILRKAGLLAECGEWNEALAILQPAILDIRKRLAQLRRADLNLLSTESALMCLERFITQTINRNTRISKGKQPENNQAKRENNQKVYISEHPDTLDENRQTSQVEIPDADQAKQENKQDEDASRLQTHEQHHVAWEAQNKFFIPRLEAPWTPYQPNEVTALFGFWASRHRFRSGPDTQVLLAYEFLRFREETGIPFWIGGDTKAACGAAERIARYSPEWSIFTIVRADEPDSIGKAITRGNLSAWTADDADRWTRFYLDAVSRTEQELSPEDWFDRGRFPRLCADVLPELLAELSTKCGQDTLDALLDWVKAIYASEKKLCYQQTNSLVKMLLGAYPREKRQQLVRALLSIPVKTGDPRTTHSFPDPLDYISWTNDEIAQTQKTALPEVKALFKEYKQGTNRDLALCRLLHCCCHGLLTKRQKEQLSTYLWKDGNLSLPKGWPRTICLKMPAPEGIQPQQYLTDALTREAQGYAGEAERPKNDLSFLNELRAVVFSERNAFSEEQISSVLVSFSARLSSLASNLGSSLDLSGLQGASVSQMYEIAHILWGLTAGENAWTPSAADREAMSEILKIYAQAEIHHCGLQTKWSQLLGRSVSRSDLLVQCLRSAEEKRALYGYRALASGIQKREWGLLPEDEIRAGVAAVSQQVSWDTSPKCIFALQVMDIVLNSAPEMMDTEMIDRLLDGLSQLRTQTAIGARDSVEAAAEKGKLRITAASLAKQLYEAGLHGSQPEVLDRWMETIHDKNEFAEIRAV